MAAFIQSKPAATHSLADIVQRFNEGRTVPVRINGATNAKHVAWIYIANKARRIVEGATGRPFTWHRVGRRIIYSQATGGLSS